MNYPPNHPPKSSWLFYYIFFGVMLLASGGAWWYASTSHMTVSRTTRVAAISLLETSANTQLPNDNRIIQKDWGISFIKNAQWVIVSASTTPTTMVLEQTSGQGQGAVITISYSVAARVTDVDVAGNPMTYYWNPDRHQWLVDGVDPRSGIAYTGVVAHPILDLSDTLPVFLGRQGDMTYITPLSFTTFLKFTIVTSDGDVTPLSDLILTLQRI